MTDRHRIPRTEMTAEPIGAVESIDAELVPTPVPLPAALSLGGQQAVGHVPLQGIHRLATRSARAGNAASAAGAPVRRHPVEQLRRQSDEVKPQLPPRLTPAQKLEKFADSSTPSFRQRTADKLAKEIKSGPGEKTRVATTDSTKLATKLRAMAMEAQQKVTADVDKVMKDGGGRREGADFALKDEKGLAEKIGEELAKKGFAADAETSDEALAAIDVSALVGDALRFTIVFDFDGFTENVMKALNFLRSSGYWTEKVGNTFKNPTAMYRGINTNWRAGDGIKWELQFHTSDSFDAKQHKNHLPYEGARMLKDGDPRKKLLEDQMVGVSSSIPTPGSLDNIQMDEWDSVTTRERRGQMDSAQPPIPEGIERIK